MIEINLGHRILSLGPASGGGGPVIVDNSGSSPWHIIDGEIITVPTRRQMAIHGFIWLQGEILLQGSAQLVIED